jgi:hypothetical protein
MVTHLYLYGDLEGEMLIEGCVQCVRLWEGIERVDRNELIPDKYIWKGAKSEVYSAKDTYTCCVKGR